MAKMTIGPKHPIRALVQNLPTYYDSKGRFVEAVRAAFDGCDLDVVCEDIAGDVGRGSWAVRPKDTTSVCCEECAARMSRNGFENWLVVTWYRLSADTIEFVTYVS
jgi:hypothetical protein